MNEEGNKEDIIDKFLAGLKNDISTRNVSFGAALKWVVLFFFTLVFFPLVAIFTLWVIWWKTEWSPLKKGVVSLGIVVFAGWIYSGETEMPASTALVIVSDETLQVQEVSKSEDPAPAIAEPVNEKVELYSVVSVTDGDTIKVDLNGTTEILRLIGIDTPETVDPRKPVQCFGEEASKKAKEILTGKKIRLEADPTQGERDKYDRLLRYVYLEDGTFFNQQMISEGYAHEYTYQSNPYKYQTNFQEAERQAREGKRGLWSDDTCSGNTTQAAAVVGAAVGSALLSDDTSSAPVKKSSTGICHAPGTTYYARTKNYTPYDTLDECLKSGGRLPKR